MITIDLLIEDSKQETLNLLKVVRDNIDKLNGNGIKINPIIVKPKAVKHKLPALVQGKNIKIGMIEIADFIVINTRPRRQPQQQQRRSALEGYTVGDELSGDTEADSLSTYFNHHIKSGEDEDEDIKTDISKSLQRIELERKEKQDSWTSRITDNNEIVEKKTTKQKQPPPPNEDVDDYEENQIDETVKNAMLQVLRGGLD